ncbi:tRNA threonylcarbamoyladenosine dehydratase [Oribacterium sp. oral taxon 102]|uniref:tRNA threonylcarbamoyladenosine dehydratase n=1 Tax=Oribacterium sp. oral taxon 102 TaxID=671214 RepID=UPI0015C1BE4F|nr:tRNA threonylcarbamoyladenosine dehydratase [Oribacterium sp. oral taxon 102]NWO21589.1 tRNA threonylcarbamoyladenosine dehydratase [Oribacterium sp. oral taxon 102]
MENPFSRTALLLGEAALERLRGARVAVFGIGGVGGYAVEALVRAGVGAFVLVDNDRVSLSNLNRQIIATYHSLGQYKVDAMQERIRDINPAAEVETRKCFFLPGNAEEFDFSEYDYVIDAVDTVTAKLEIIMRAKRCGVPVISSMGAGNKLDPTRFRLADIYQTSVCPLARVMRQECRKHGIESLNVVYSTEKAVSAGHAAAQPKDAAETGGWKIVPGSVSFVPSVAGLLLAGAVVRELISERGEAPEAFSG